MDFEPMNHYEKQLYTVFKTFDVDNEEALEKSAVLELCDALQLEDRGVTLVESLFERRSDRVTFTQFRNGLLSVLGAGEPAPLPAAATAAAAAGLLAPASHSDEDSSGHEVAPKFVFGSKRYGRRSRPQRVTSDAAPRPRVASEPRINGERSKQRARCKRSASAMESRDSAPEDAAAEELEHGRRVDREAALSLCRTLRMPGIDSGLVDGVFEDVTTDEITVGDFFDRLNTSLTTSIAASMGGASAAARDTLSESRESEMEDALPSDAVVEAWERAGVQRPRRLLLELGFSSSSVRPAELERALDRELGALSTPPDGPAGARNLLFLASLALARLRAERSERWTSAAAAERDKLRGDLAEANRRARLLAQDVDENHARIETELKASLRQVELKHAEASRAAAAELAGERERAAAACARLRGEAARRADCEQRCRAQLTDLRERLDATESRALAAEERAQQAERERARLASECDATQRGAAAAADAARLAAESREAALEELRLENKSLRDRNDELCAALEAAPPGGARGAAGAGAPWRDEAPLDASLPFDEGSECDSSTLAASPSAGEPGAAERLRAVVASLQQLSLSADGECETCSTVARALATLGEAGAGRGEDDALEDARRAHAEEKAQLLAIISELESSLEQLKADYDRCEEYWAGKLEEERAASEAEQRAGDERLAELARAVAEYERQFARAPLPAIEELAALEQQATAAEEELAAYRRDTEAELAAARRRLEELERPAPAAAAPRRPPQGCASCASCAACASCPACACVRSAAALRARAARAERAAQRLAARLAAADLLVKDLYLENCRLAHRPRLP